jgi:hypothetical protein
MSNPKPVKFGFKNAVACDCAPDVYKPGWKKLYDYGLETGALCLQLKHTKDPAALLEELLQRAYFERDGWLRMSPPEYAGAAKQLINIEGHLFMSGHDKHTVKAAEYKTDELIGMSAITWHADLREVRDHNRDARSMLPCCACCGKYNPHKRLFCGKCNVAVYCGVDCQKQHWEVHKLQCGKPACAACGKIPENPIPMICGRCRAVTYCHKAHQTWHWHYAHKQECKKK